MGGPERTPSPAAPTRRFTRMSIEIPGLVFAVDQRYVLVHGREAARLAAPVFGPPVFVRPGYRFFSEATYLLPTEAIDDFGQVYEPPDCYEWIETRGDLFPRSDVVGTTPAGASRTAFMKELDLTELALFASPKAGGLSAVRLALVVEACNLPGGLALAPAPCPAPLQLLARAVPCYGLAPAAFSHAAGLMRRVFGSGRRDVKVRLSGLGVAN